VPGAQCPGGATCVCTSNDNCDSGVCIEGPGGKECAATCVDNCEGDFICVLVSSGGGDQINVCVHAQGRLCDPCASTKDCVLPGHGQAACVDQGADGAFCGTVCTLNEECPKGYGCQSLTSVEGAKVKQCVRLPDPDSEAKIGTCPCSKWAVAAVKQTDCFILSKDPEGKVVGQCPGVRKCLDEGLSKCQAPEPMPEICDGVDSDCNGETDEGTCEDKNVCTKDSCNPAFAIDGEEGCVHKPVDVQCDADGSECTENDKCTKGKCTPGKPKGCADGNPCTDDGCMKGGGCIFSNNTDPCDDGQKCTVGDKCKVGKCSSGSLKSCDDKNGCTQDNCNIQTGKCAYNGVPFEGSPCDADGSICTQADKCVSGKCTPGKLLKCDDGNPCTSDACDTKNACKFTPNNEKCDDGDACTIDDVCLKEKCIAKPKSCSDGNACTTDTCDKKKGCAHAEDMNLKLCGDGKVCMGNTCKATVCGDGIVHTAVEKCDGANVVANNCNTVLGNGSFGSLSCAKDRLTFDTSKCTDLGWMERTDDCEGFRQSTMHPGVRFAVAKDTTWIKAKVYPCPKGYNASTSASRTRRRPRPSSTPTTTRASKSITANSPSSSPASSASSSRGRGARSRCVMRPSACGCGYPWACP